MEIAEHGAIVWQPCVTGDSQGVSSAGTDDDSLALEALRLWSMPGMPLIALEAVPAMR